MDAVEVRALPAPLPAPAGDDKDDDEVSTPPNSDGSTDPAPATASSTEPAPASGAAPAADNKTTAAPPAPETKPPTTASTTEPAPAADNKAAPDQPGAKKKKKHRFKFEAKTPNFKLAPKPYLSVEAKNQRLKGRCSLQPTVVLLLEHSIGAKLTVEPYVELEASRPTARDKWKLDAQAGVSVNAATDVEIFGRQIGKPKEFTLFEIALTKPGDEMGTVPKVFAPASAPPGSQGGTQVAGLMNQGPGSGGSAPGKPVATKKPTLKINFWKKKK